MMYRLWEGMVDGGWWWMVSGGLELRRGKRDYITWNKINHLLFKSHKKRIIDLLVKERGARFGAQGYV